MPRVAAKTPAAAAVADSPVAATIPACGSSRPYGPEEQRASRPCAARPPTSSYDREEARPAGNPPIPRGRETDRRKPAGEGRERRPPPATADDEDAARPCQRQDGQRLGRPWSSVQRHAASRRDQANAGERGAPPPQAVRPPTFPYDKEEARPAGNPPIPGGRETHRGKPAGGGSERRPPPATAADEDAARLCHPQDGQRLAPPWSGVQRHAESRHDHANAGGRGAPPPRAVRPPTSPFDREEARSAGNQPIPRGRETDRGKPAGGGRERRPPPATATDEDAARLCHRQDGQRLAVSRWHSESTPSASLSMWRVPPPDRVLAHRLRSSAGVVPSSRAPHHGRSRQPGTACRQGQRPLPANRPARYPPVPRAAPHRHTAQPGDSRNEVLRPTHSAPTAAPAGYQDDAPQARRPLRLSLATWGAPHRCIAEPGDYQP